VDELIAQTSKALNARGIRGSLIAHRNSLYWRGYFNEPSGKRTQKRIHIGLSAHKGQLLEAERRVIELAAAVGRLGMLPDQLPWATETRKSSELAPVALTVAEATTLLEQSFWKGKAKTSAAERTWDRIELELRRLPNQAVLTTPLLLATADATRVGSRTRLEACKVYKRLGKLVGLDGLEQLDELRAGTQYKPERRDLPTDEDLLKLLEELPDGHHWSWPTWALVTYGCRPSEVFSLQAADNGTAQVLTIKVKNQLPEWRTALAIPVGEVGAPTDNRSWVVKKPSEYDSATAKRHTGAWGKWISARAPGLQLYDLRHAWAIRSILKNVNPSLAAKCMGHSLAVHHNTYHRELSKRDVAAVAAQLIGE